jgi:hypothetical protein
MPPRELSSPGGIAGAGGSFSGSGEGPRGGGGVPVPLAIAKSWRPYGGTAAEAGGTAIYRHEAAAPGAHAPHSLLCAAPRVLCCAVPHAGKGGKDHTNACAPY